MKFLNGLLIIAVFTFMTACGGGAETKNTEGGETANTETKKEEGTDKKAEETKKEEAKAPAALLSATKWMMDGEAMLAAMPEEQKKGLTEEQKKSMLENAKKVTVQYNADGTFVGAKGDTEEKGTWTLSEDGKTLTTKDAKDKEESLTIKELTAEKIVFEIPAKKEGEKAVVITLVPAVASDAKTAESTEKKEETKPEEKKEEKKVEEKH